MGSYLSHLAEIVEMILRNLSAKNLRRVAGVNQMWRAISSRLLAGRTGWTVHYTEERHLSKEQMINSAETLFAEPQVVILFSHKETWRSGFRSVTPRPAELNERRLARSVRTLHSCLPRNCILVGCSTERIIVPHPLGSEPAVKLNHREAGHAFACIPRMAGVSFHAASVLTARPPASASWPELFGVAPHTPVRLVILFALSVSRDFFPSLAAGSSSV